MNIIHYLKRQSFIENILLLLLFVGGANLFIFIKTSGIENITFSFNAEREVVVLKAYARVSISSFIIGCILLLNESYIHPYVTRNLSFIFKRLVWQLGVALIITVPIAVVFTISEMIDQGYSLWYSVQNTSNFLTSGVFISYFIYYYILSSVISFLRRLRNTFGQNIFYNYLIGKYSSPLEEHRVFMFIDLNDSTALAENLGHTKYSRLLNKCFDDIIMSLKRFDYDIYQFVGDEIVFTWLTNKDKSGQSIAMFEAIKNQLQNFKEMNIKLFGVQPRFKAAVSCGPVTGTLVGHKSKNIAYHGDVLNTASRLLGLCKSFKEDILITDFYLSKLKETLNFETTHLVTLKLKGKSNATEVYRIKTLMGQGS
ncbi:MAG: adenylate/guanylate cyclase domain-containing protein [Bacteroidota bacterium]